MTHHEFIISLQCNQDIRELSGLENNYLISGFGLFCYIITGSNLGPAKISLISGFLLYPGYTVFVLLMMTPAGAKSIWENYGAFLNSFHPEIKHGSIIK